MKNRTRKAFTLVELVIVIAVIAILAAVMIPTFGAIIDSANKASDQSTAANLTVALSQKLGGVSSEAELYQVIADTFGEDYANSIAPKTASKGNHFWYDVANNRVILEEYGKLDEVELLTASVDDNSGVQGVAKVESIANGATNFAPGSLRTITVDGRQFFLIDKSGSDVVDILNSMDEISSVDTHTGLLDKLANLDDTLGAAIALNLESVAILNNYGMFTFTNAPSSIYIPEGTTTLGVATYVDGYTDERSSVDFSNVSSAIKLPEGVKVGSYSLLGFVNSSDTTGLLNNTTEIHVNTTEDKLGEVFEAFSTDAVIVLPNGARYIVEGAEIYKLPKGSDPLDGELGSSSTEDIEFEISYTDNNTNAGQDNDYLNNGTLYVSYDIGTAQLGLTNGITNSMVNWTVQGSEYVQVDANGKLTITTPELGKAVSATVTATLKANSEKSASITVYIVRPTGITLAGGENGNIVFEGGYTFTITTSTNYNPANVVKSEKPTLSLSDASKNYFTLADNGDGTWTLTLTERADGDYTGAVAEINATAANDLVTNSLTLNLIDNTGKAFEKNNITDDVKMGDTYLFRVGNGNVFTLGQLFNNTKPANNVVLEIYDWSEGGKDNIHISTTTGFKVSVTGGTAITKTENGVTETTGWSLSKDNWASTKLDFDGTGVAKIWIGNKVGETYTGYAELLVEVVDGKNVTSYSELKNATNYVLLSDITLTSGSWSLSNGTLFGNGFTFDVTAGEYTGTGYITENYLIGLNNANIDNTVIVGPVYNKYNITAKADYNRAVVSSQGTSGIYNSYISNASAPVRICNGELTMVNITLKGGSFANLDMRGGDLIIDDVTTINQLNANDAYSDTKTTIGLGIVVWYEGTNGSETITRKDLNGNGTAGLTQYNYLANNQASHFASTDSAFDVSSLVALLFNIDDDYVKDVNGVKWVHTGILSMDERIDDDSVTQPDGYGVVNVSYSGKNGVAFIKAASSYADPASITTPSYSPSAQYHVLPTISWDLPEKSGDKNYIAKTEDPDYCYYDKDIRTVMIRFEKEDSLGFDPTIFTATKLGNALNVAITMNGVDYSNNNITFTEAGSYEIIYTYIDPYNYHLGDDGVKTYEVAYTKTLKVNVILKDKAIDPATFTFAGTTDTNVLTGTDGTKYLSVVGGSNTGTKTVAGQTVTYINVYVKYTNYLLISSSSLNQSNSSTSLKKSYNNIAYCPVFDGVVTITDNGTTYNGSTTTMANGKLTMVSDGKGLTWASASTPSYDPVVKSNALYFESVKIQGVTRSKTTYVFEYTYTDDSGETYHYFVGYIFPKKA